MKMKQTSSFEDPTTNHTPTSFPATKMPHLGKHAWKKHMTISILRQPQAQATEEITRKLLSHLSHGGSKHSCATYKPIKRMDHGIIFLPPRLPSIFAPLARWPRQSGVESFASWMPTIALWIQNNVINKSVCGHIRKCRRMHRGLFFCVIRWKDFYRVSSFLWFIFVLLHTCFNFQL